MFLLDEPLSNLDLELRVETRAEIRALHERVGATMVHVTHDQTEALVLGDRIAVLRDGRIEQVGTPDEIWRTPATTFVARFVGSPAMNLLPADGPLRLAGTCRRRRVDRLPPGGGACSATPLGRRGRRRAGRRRRRGRATPTSASTGTRSSPGCRPPAGPPSATGYGSAVRWPDVHVFDAATGRRVAVPLRLADPDAERRQLVLMLAPYLVGLVGAGAAARRGHAGDGVHRVRPHPAAAMGRPRQLRRAGRDDPAFRAALDELAGVRGHRRAGAAAHRARPRAAAAPAGPRWSAPRGRRRCCPTAVPEIAYGLLWLWLLNPLYGPINQVLRLGGENGLTVLGRTPPQWLTDPTDARAAIILMSLFTIGETFIILLAARRALPPEVYELAAIEDATGWDVFRRITLPLMAPVLGLLLLRDTILSLQISFVPALVVTEGGPPPYATTYLSLFVYRNAFEYLRYGYAAAATLVMLVLTLVAVAMQWRLIRRYERHTTAERG